MNRAVITADIIHSSKLTNDVKRMVYKSVENVLLAVNEDFNTMSETYRGDSFQCLVKNPKDALRVALIIRTFIRSLNFSERHEVSKVSKPLEKKVVIYPVWMFDVRMTIGIGSVNLKMKNISTSDGIAFQLSGRLLDEIKDSKNRFAITSADRYNEELRMESALLDVIINSTTALQCEVINLKLLGFTEIEIAKQLYIKQEAVNQRSVSGNWNIIKKMIHYFETIYSNG